ncbi:hypothetical protein BP422_19450 [Brevibacillus formosus]|uniref:YcdB/YcdC repeated domain-containing protein n=1 Tax=Brevibacillus formosus TaxID=54913 RepID=A0A220MSA5_9BACL|nr:YcdB/YcdC domain-containing protein [Brevibacillus formosus]ASJ57609.1 hypothetical protein BP422_19450 [Brevibacillus formosus]
MNKLIPEVKEQDYSKALQSALQLLRVPEGYQLKSAQEHKQNQNVVWVFRYEKISGDNNGLGGEHFSFVVEKNTYKILGVTWMDQRLAAGELPSKEETKAFAKTFLSKAQPGLFEKLENLWIDNHDETIVVTKGDKRETVTISGMKYKCYLPEENNYVWVIVGPGGQIITFEQGIIWSNGRVTEKWLHDSWVEESI